MKYVVLIIDGAAGLPIPGRGNKTTLELAKTPNLDALSREGTLGLARTVPLGMEPSSACACMSVMGYDPAVYYKGRAPIEAKSMGISVGKDEVVFRCNLVTIAGGKMRDYSAGHIGSEEAKLIIESLNAGLGNEDIKFYPGVSYRHLLKLRGHDAAANAACTPPHDIAGKDVEKFLPRGAGSAVLLDMMKRSESILEGHPVNKARLSRGELPVTSIWLFWGSGPVPDMPSFKKAYGLAAAMTSGVDLLKGLAKMAAMDILDISGVTDGPDSNHTAQVEGALKALDRHDLVIIHIEAPDEAGHGGLIDEKIRAIEDVDRQVVSRLRGVRNDFCFLVMPDHPTPVTLRTHVPDPVPFLLWGKGVTANGGSRFTEAEAKKTGVFIGEGYKIMGRLTER